MTFIWGLINGILGLITYLGKKVYVLEKIKKVLLVNIYLDSVYFIVGVFLILLGNGAIFIGSGIGITIQGIFLFTLDLFHHIYIKKIIALQ